MRRSLDTQLKRLADDRWARYSVRMMLRAVWCGLSVWCLGLGAHLLFGWPLRFETLVALALGCVVIGALLLLRPRMSPHDAARRLDRRFGLNNQLATALEVDGRGAPEGIAVHLLDQSFRTVGRIRRYVNHHQRFPWSELGIVLALAVIGIGLLLMIGLDTLRLQPAEAVLPPLAGVEDPAQEFPPEPFTPPQSAEQAVPPEGGEQAQSDPAANAGTPQQAARQAAALAELADALRDQSVTRPVAEALDQGDTAAAAQELRRLADQAGQLSQATREDLADALRDAAARIEPEAPDLAEQLRRNADGLQQGGQSAAQAFDELAQMMEQLGGQGQSAQGQSDQVQDQAEQAQSDQGQQGQGGGAGNTALPGEQREQAQPAERLGVEGVPLELESEGDGRSPADGDAAEERAAGTGSGSFEVGEGTPDSTKVQTGEDPLRIPADLRDVVQEYFSPAD